MRDKKKKSNEIKEEGKLSELGCDLNRFKIRREEGVKRRLMRECMGGLDRDKKR